MSELVNSVIVNTNEPIVISKETIKRLLKDVKEMIKNPLETEGIYYKHDEINMLKGYVITPINRQRWSLKQMMV